MLGIEIAHGRELVVAKSIVVAYGLVIAGAALRVVAPVVLPTHYVGSMVAAAAAWVGAFVIFLFVYVPILVTPRNN
jgi:uncharacterized protein involved in response to NO